MFRQFFDKTSHTYTYLLADEEGNAVLIDPVRGQEERDLTQLDELGLTLRAVLETHVHADHITAAAEIKARTGCAIVYPSSSDAVGADRYLDHGEVLAVGGVRLEALHTPGHTSGCACYRDLDHPWVFTGDTLLIRGCGRTDFQQGDAAALYRSVHEHLFTLDDHTVVWPAHDYHGRTASTVGEERAHNPRLGGGRSLEDFVQTMAELDLAYPRMLDVAVPANRRLGVPPDPWGDLHRNETALQAPIAWVREHADDVRLVDVRQPDEYHGPLGHVPGAELVPLADLAQSAADWDRDAPLVLVCRSGGRSDRAAAQLEAMGFSRVASMTGGTVGWMQGTEPSGSCG
jgi:glyoxylase-like metal-dependent hydrolase (beta-lactamase superfamily II)/rhodanese-related sulfurtransferase